MFTSSLLALLLLCSVVSTTPIVIRNSPIRVPLTRRLNVTSVSNLLKHDQARAKALQARTRVVSTAIVGNEPVDNQAVTYVGAIGIGTPPTTCEYCGDQMHANDFLTFVFRSVNH
jgi:cathepsin E